MVVGLTACDAFLAERDLSAERADIKLWFRAMGQINAMPVSRSNCVN